MNDVMAATFWDGIMSLDPHPAQSANARDGVQCMIESFSLILTHALRREIPATSDIADAVSNIHDLTLLSLAIVNAGNAKASLAAWAQKETTEA